MCDIRRVFVVAARSEIPCSKLACVCVRFYLALADAIIMMTYNKTKDIIKCVMGIFLEYNMQKFMAASEAYSLFVSAVRGGKSSQ